MVSVHTLRLKKIVTPDFLRILHYDGLHGLHELHTLHLNLNANTRYVTPVWYMSYN